GPYLSAVDILALQPATPRGVFRRMVLSAYEALAGPIGAIRVAAGPPWMTTVATPGRDFAGLGMTIALAGAALWVQVGVTIAMYVRAVVRGRDGGYPLGGLAWAGAFVVMACLLTPLITGQAPSRDGRDDLLAQFLPVMLDLALERTTGRHNACGPRCPEGTGRYVVTLPDEPMPEGSRDVWHGSGLRVWWVEG